MIGFNIWDDGVSWEDRCRCIQTQKDELSKKVHTLEDALRHARTRCEHLESLVKQAARRHLQQNFLTIAETDVVDHDHNSSAAHLSADQPNVDVLLKNKYNRDEQDFIRDLQKRNSTLQQQSNKDHQKLKYAAQLIKKYKKEINTLRLRVESKRRFAKSGSDAKRKGLLQKSVDFYNGTESETDELDQLQIDLQPIADVSKAIPLDINSVHKDEKIIRELNETKVAYTLLQTQYSALNSKMDSQCKIQKQLIAKLEESNDYVAKLQNDAQVMMREKSITMKSLQTKLEEMDQDMSLLKRQNSSLKDKLNSYITTDDHIQDHRQHHGQELPSDQRWALFDDHQEHALASSGIDKYRLDQDIESLRKKSADDQKQIKDLQSELRRSFNQVNELSSNIEKLTNELTESRRSTDIINENHRLAKEALQEALSTQTMSFRALESEIKEKEVHIKITLDEFKATIESLESKCSYQLEYINHLEQSRVMNNRSALTNEEDEEEELPLVANEYHECCGDVNLPHDGLQIHHHGYLPRFWYNVSKEDCYNSILKVQIIEANLSSCSILNHDKNCSTFVVLDVLDFESQASSSAQGIYPVYNFESFFSVQSWMCVMAKYYNQQDLGGSDRCEAKGGERKKDYIPKGSLMIGIYLIEKNRRTSLLAWSTPHVDWSFTAPNVEIEKTNCTWQSLEVNQHNLISPDDRTSIMGNIRLRIGFKRNGDDIYYHI